MSLGPLSENNKLKYNIGDRFICVNTIVQFDRIINIGNILIIGNKVESNTYPYYWLTNQLGISFIIGDGFGLNRIDSHFESVSKRRIRIINEI